MVIIRLDEIQSTSNKVPDDELEHDDMLLSDDGLDDDELSDDSDDGLL